MAVQASQAAFARNEPDGRCASGPVAPVGGDLFGLGMAAVVLLCLEHDERGVGEHGVVAPDGEQLPLSGGRPGTEVADAADDQPGGDRLPSSWR